MDITFKRLLLAATFLGLQGCGDKTPQEIKGDLVGKLSCNSSEAMNADQISVNGELQSGINESTAFQLSENAGCTGAENVRWNAPSAKSMSVAGDAFVSTYSEPGSYKVAADLETQNRNLGTIVSSATVVVGSTPILTGPQVSFEFVDATYAVLLPTDYQLSSIQWTMGDSSAPITSGLTVVKNYATAGNYNINVEVTNTNNEVTRLSQVVQVLPFFEELLCAGSVGISGPVEIAAGATGVYSTLLPQCLKDFGATVSWNMGDASSSKSGETVSHVYAASGSYNIIVQITMAHPRVQSLTLTHAVRVLESSSDLHKCSTLGETRERISGERDEVRACGVQGQQTLRYQTTVTERCELVGQYRDWQVVSQNEVLISTGPCQNQSCEMPGGGLLGNGESRVFYSTRNAPGQCSEVAANRTCSNGVLSDPTSHTEQTCNSGCGSFGIHGTTQTGVITGEREVSKTCQFGETGIFDVFNELSDLACNQGQIQTSNIRLGDLKVPGLCPSYRWVSTDIFTTCTADCGGEQARIFVCQDDKGSSAAEDRCTDVKPIETRLCDANPEAVRRTDVSSAVEDGGSSTTCPSNQIGVIVRERDVTTTRVFACINHEITAESESVSYGPWEETRYCRDYVPHRCNHDSLSVSQAQGRYAWMQKCRSQIPVIDEFLTQFDDVSVNRNVKGGKQKSSLTSGRLLYPTFMNRAYNPEKAWIAPTMVSAACSAPAEVYVAAVCVASCATPEQEIIAQAKAKANGSLSKMTFIEAFTSQAGFVGTLKSNSTMSSKELQKTKVDNWVTEIVDSEHQILNFKMASGGTLRITTNHPLVTDAGQMQMANDFKVGDNLVKLGGVADKIASITPEIYFGKVYNVFVKSSDLKHNVVVTNGYLNGTAFYQNEGAKNLNRQILRGRIIKGALPR
jgi:hypothetical protein